MTVIHIGYGDVAVSIMFVLVAIAIVVVERTGEARQIVVAALRAFFQLMAAGYVIRIVFSFTSLWPTLAVIGVMIAAAAQIAGRRGRAASSSSYLISGVAIAVGSVATLVTLIASGIVPARPQFMIPIAGMLVGNTMSATGIALRELGRERVRSRPEIEAALVLGASIPVATSWCRSRTIRASTGPLIDATKAVGVVALPGAMTGMILAGISPLVAVRLQVIVMFMLLGATALSVWIAVRLGTRALFDAHERMIPVPPRTDAAPSS